MSKVTNIFMAEKICRHLSSRGATKEEMIPIYAEAYEYEHKRIPGQHRLHNHSHGIKRGLVVSLLSEKVTANHIAGMLPISNPVDARSAALFHLNCLVNEGVLKKVHEGDTTTYKKVERAK